MVFANRAKNEVQKTRIEWVDWLKGIMMLVIIVSHIGAPDIYVRLYTPVFLTIYFFLSGYTWSPKKNFKGFLIRKFQNLIIPLLCLGTVNALLAIAVEGDSWIDRFGGLLIQRSCIWDDLWFIACLFSAQMIFYAVYKISSKLKIYKITLMMLLSLTFAIIGFVYIRYIDVKLPWQFENALTLQLFVASGYLYRNYGEEKMKRFERTFVIPLVLLVAYVALVLSFNNDVNVHSERYGNEAVFVVSALVGILFLVYVAKGLGRTRYVNNPLYSFTRWGG